MREESHRLYFLDGSSGGRLIDDSQENGYFELILLDRGDCPLEVDDLEEVGHFHLRDELVVGPYSLHRRVVPQVSELDECCRQGPFIPVEQVLERQFFLRESRDLIEIREELGSITHLPATDRSLAKKATFYSTGHSRVALLLLQNLCIVYLVVHIVSTLVQVFLDVQVDKVVDCLFIASLCHHFHDLPALNLLVNPRRRS